MWVLQRSRGFIAYTSATSGDRGRIGLYVESSDTIDPGQRAVLEHLEAHVDGYDEGFSWETALARLAEHDIEEAAARDRIEALLLKGYLYEVEENLRIPPRPYE